MMALYSSILHQRKSLLSKDIVKWVRSKMGSKIILKIKEPSRDSSTLIE